MATRAPAAWETRRPLLPELALIVATIAFGSTFKLVQNVGGRHSGRVPAPAPRCRRARARPVRVSKRLAQPRAGAERSGTDDFRSFVTAGIFFGAIGWVGYWFQNTGLQHTTTSDSAFITGLFVVFTPLVETIMRRRFPNRLVIGAVSMAAVGLFLLTGARFGLGRGNALTLGCAASFGVWIYVGGRLANRFDAVALVFLEMVTFTALSLPLVVVDGMGHVTGRVWLAVAVTGVLCSAVGFTLQLWGQRRIEPARPR